jgi:hypothetical protein
MNAGPEPGSPQSVVRALVAVADADLLYADRYLDRAAALLAPLCPLERFGGLEAASRALPRLTGDLRQATEHGDWERVHALAREAQLLRDRLQGTEDILRLGAAVYGPRQVRGREAALLLAGVLGRPRSRLEEERAATVSRLRLLVAHDAAWGPFYAERLSHFELLPLVAVLEEAPSVDGEALRRQLLHALEGGEFSEVARLAEAMRGRGRAHGGPSIPARAATGGDRWRLHAPLPAASLGPAAELGLVPRALRADPQLGGLVGGWIDASAAPSPESQGVRPELRDSLRRLLDRLVVNFAGRRYVPTFGDEELLVETFGEDEPDTRSALLDLLGLPRRRGLPRLLIEDALRRRNARVCDALGLDVLEFTVACIPFDAYVRLAPGEGWGRKPLWTHFDGYQLLRDQQLRALVGGDVRYGGADDVCSVGVGYDSEHLTARFVVVRRGRFAAGQAPGSAPA